MTLRVALLHPVYWPEVRRGSERFARELADGLLARGHRPRLIVGHRGWRPRTTVEDGLPVTRVPRLPEGRLDRRQYEPHLTHVPFAAAALRAGGPFDVVHALHPVSALAAPRDTPLVLSIMGVPHHANLATRRWRLEIWRRALERADAIVALSETAARATERWLGVRPRVIAPGVDLAAFTPGGQRAPTPVILCAADATAPYKRVGLLAEAFARVQRERPDARLVLSRPRRGAVPFDGDGIDWRDLDDRDALVAACREAHVAALPSVGEAFGLVLAEALACGTPVVGSVPEVLGDDDRVGRLFTGDSADALALALLEAIDLAADPQTTARCRAHAEAFGIDRTVDAYVALYREIGS